MGDDEPLDAATGRRRADVCSSARGRGLGRWPASPPDPRRAAKPEAHEVPFSIPAVSGFTVGCKGQGGDAAAGCR